MRINRTTHIPSITNPDLITQLPAELSAFVLSHVSNKDLENCMQVSKTWNRIIIREITKNEITKSIEFTKNILKQLRNEKALSNKINNITEYVLNRPSDTFQSLKHLKAIYIRSIKNKIIHVLSSSHADQITSIQNTVTVTPLFFENIFRISQIESRLYLLYNETDEHSRVVKLSQISKDFLLNQEVERPILIAKTITDKEISDPMWIDISLYLMKNQNSHCIKTAANISDKYKRNPVISQILEEFVKLEKINQILEATVLIKDQQTREDLLNTIGIYLQCNNVISLIIDNAYRIENEIQRAKALKNVCYLLTMLVDLQQAMQIANSIPCEKSKEQAFKIISKSFSKVIEQKPIHIAIKVVELIPHKRQRIRAIQKIAIRLFRENNLKKSIKIADSIPTRKARMVTFKKLFGSLVKRKQFNKAVELVKVISKKEDKKKMREILLDETSRELLIIERERRKGLPLSIQAVLLAVSIHFFLVSFQFFKTIFFDLEQQKSTLR